MNERNPVGDFLIYNFNTFSYQEDYKQAYFRFI